MSDIIHLLPDSVANQIAAGEVIQRPASVLKELVENSIDAGATSIQILIKDAGRSLIQISDNGKGMSETDARLSFERHATSKIKDANDLFSISTMGFRGEALASIAAVAHVEMRSKREEDELGTLIEIAGSRVFKQEIVQCNKGTLFQIKNLFFNVPARRRFLKSDNVEKSHLLQEFYRIALVNPGIEFSFFDGDTEVFRLPESNLKIRIDNIFGGQKKKLNQQLLSIETETNLVNIRGFVGRPEFAQKQAHQYFFVNGRYMRHPYFHKAVILAYNQLIQPTDNPAYFIYFEVDPQTIDINIHPTKTEIKFENEQAIWSILSATIKEALGKFNVVPSIDFDNDGSIDILPSKEKINIIPPTVSFNPSYNPFGTSTYKRADANWDDLYKGFEKSKNEPLPTTIFQSKINEDEAATSNEYYQLKNKYIVTSVKSGMLMIDQRRAHIRILYDQFFNEINSKRGNSQQLLFPESYYLMPENIVFFEQVKEDLSFVGFDFEIDENCHYLIKGVPSLLKSTSTVQSLLDEIIESVKDSSGKGHELIVEKIALLLAESIAIQSGQSLGNKEMADLVERLFMCPSHTYTPEGKLIIALWSLDEIQERFNQNK